MRNIVEIAREQVIGEIVEACGEARGVGVDLAPKMQPTIEDVIDLDLEATGDFAFKAE